MSLDYSLKVEAPLTAEQVLSLLADQLGLKRSSANSMIGVGLWVGARDINLHDEDATSDFTSDYGFQPAASISFQVQESGSGSTYEELYKVGYDQLGRVLSVLLSHTAGDAVMLMNGEQVVLQRAAGRLILNQGWEEEIAPQLSAAGVPYEVRPLRSPALEEQVPTKA